MSENPIKDDELVSSHAANKDDKVSPQQSCSIEQLSTKDPEHNLRNCAYQSSDDESDLFSKTKRRVQRFSDSDSEDTNKHSVDKTPCLDLNENSNSEDSLTVFKSTAGKSRIRKVSTSEDEASDTEKHVSKYTEQQSRVKNKKQSLKDKFKTLINSKSNAVDKINESRSKSDAVSKKYYSGSSKESSEAEDESNITEDEMSSIEKIKEIIKEKTTTLKMSICDPDTSDEESNQNKNLILKPKSKKELKKTKLTSPKPQRMSAKQAMENMQKIKSESNRMLREKEVSLPYHRPKALSLQDIMKRRRPALSSDGKALPIKMNEEQLKQYALLLEERHKEMMELCKSDTEEDEPDEEEISKELKDNIVDTNNLVAISLECNKDKSEKTSQELPLESTEISQKNDATFDRVFNDTVETSQSNTEGPSDNNTITLEASDANGGQKDLVNNSGDVSAELELIYNDSIEEGENKFEDKSKVEDSETTKKTDEIIEDEKEALVSNNDDVSIDINKEPEPLKHNTEIESQLISLRYLDSEINEGKNEITDNISNKEEEVHSKSDNSDKKESEINDFPDEDIDMDDINMDEIDSIIENAEIIKNVDSPALIKDIPVLSVKPKLTGAPGMVIDLDGTDPTAPKKLTGVELLKERFSFYAKLKTPEEMEREREKRQKPGTLHLKLKQELEDKIAEQRSLEWSKRLDGEKQQEKELSALRGDESEPEDDIDKIEAKLDETDIADEDSSSESEEEPIEDDIILEDKPKKRNPLVADEAEESDADETVQDGDKEMNDDENNDVEECDENDEEKDEDESSEDESSESEDEIESNKPKKGRILKAFEDSDDEDTPKTNQKDPTPAIHNVASDENESDKPLTLHSQSDIFTDSQDDVIQLAQIPKQISDDVVTTPECGKSQSDVNSVKEDELLPTQTFSILNTNNTTQDLDLQLDDSDKHIDKSETDGVDKLTVISETQPCDDNLDAVVGMCSGSFSQNYVEFKPPTTQSQSQPIGEDLLNMCTGNFYDNQFVTPQENHDKLNTSDDFTQDPTTPTPSNAKVDDNGKNPKKHDEDILKSVLDELNEPELAKPLKFFFDGNNQNKENEKNLNNTQVKKRLVIDSDDDEANENVDDKGTQKKRKKFKKKKLEDRALQISDDEEDEYSELEEEDEYLSDNQNEEEKLVEYDSEENEVEVIPLAAKKKKKKASEFFEQEAELTSEDEWVGSGDEDEAGLDRMEREAGDDETFHQGRLQRELGQIHMRDVLDQDKREVRLIQELLFEDGDLGAGGRQRKFRWRDADGEEATGTVPDEFADTQEEEFESEEQWRKQRHEREMFLRQMKNEGEKDEQDLDVSVNRTTIIKANLNSRTMSSLLEEVNQTKTEVTTTVATAEKKTTKDIPSPKKSFTVFQQSYHGSLLTRGRGALARLAALATPLVADDDAPKQALAPASKRNFVFAAIAPEDVEPKVNKRKAENVGTPRLVKKMKTEEKQKYTKNSLLDHLKT